MRFGHRKNSEEEMQLLVAVEESLEGVVEPSQMIRCGHPVEKWISSGFFFGCTRSAAPISEPSSTPSTPTRRVTPCAGTDLE